MSLNHLEFELPLVELENKLAELQDLITSGDQTKAAEYAKLEKLLAKERARVYGGLTAHQRVQLSRHADRPFTLDYVKLMLTDFIELHGDRAFRDDKTIVGGLGKLGTQRIMIIGHQRGRTTQERMERNFGMPQPDGYRKALRLMKLAEKFGLPVICLIDTPGAYPGIEAEERGQSEAIARNLEEMANLEVPTISVVIGEGGSGGALAIGVSDVVLMLENACYSVISPEGCASILWENASQYVGTAAEALKITAKDLKSFGIIEEIINEPIGGAHRNHKEMAEILKACLIKYLASLSPLSVDELREKRYKKFRGIGVYTEN